MLERLIALLQKIGRQKRPVGIEIDYDGSRWKWRVKMSNLSAEEFGVVEWKTTRDRDEQQIK